MNEGWICPRCGKSNAPDVKTCACESDKELKKQNNDLEELKKLFDQLPKQSELSESFNRYPNHYWSNCYPDWTYRPYYQYWYPWYTTVASGTVGIVDSK